MLGLFSFLGFLGALASGIYALDTLTTRCNHFEASFRDFNLFADKGNDDSDIRLNE